MKKILSNFVINMINKIIFNKKIIIEINLKLNITNLLSIMNKLLFF